MAKMGKMRPGRGGVSPRILGTRGTAKESSQTSKKELFGADLYCRKDPFGANLYTQRPPFGSDYYWDINSEMIFG